MKKIKSNSLLLKNSEAANQPNSHLAAKRPNSLQSKKITRFDKSMTIINQAKSSSTPQPNCESKLIPPISVKNIQNLKNKPKEEGENYLLNTLKTFVLRSSRELNMIQKEIPKFSARKIQDLKKGYKFTEDYDSLASSFLMIFTEIDPELKKETVSLRMKVGENLIGYFSNSGKFVTILRNLSDILKKTEISNKSLNDSLKIFETVKRGKLSTNYQDFYDFMQLILGYFKGKKNSTRVLADHNNVSFSSTCKTPEKMINTQCFISNPTENSFLDLPNPMSCTSKSISQLCLFNKPPKDPRKKDESIRSVSHCSLTKRLNRLDDSKNSENEGSSKENYFLEKKKEWEEIRQRKRCLETEKFRDMINELNLKRVENLKFEKLVQEQRKKEKLDIKQYKEEEFQERKRLKRLRRMEEKMEIEDEINRYLQKSLIGKKSEDCFE